MRLSLFGHSPILHEIRSLLCYSLAGYPFISMKTEGAASWTDYAKLLRRYVILLLYLTGFK